MKTAICALRSLLFYLGYASSLLIYATFCLLVGPFLGLQGRYRLFTQWNRFALLWLRLCCGISHRIEGLENIPKQGSYVVLSNHQSPWETLSFYVLFLPICATLKRELLRIPFFGWTLALMKPIAIDRSRRTAALQTLLNQGKERLDWGINVLVFPEGTRINPGDYRRFTSGGAEMAINARVPVLPVTHNAGNFWPARRFIKFPGEIQVVIGKPISTDGRKARELSQEVEAQVLGALANMPQPLKPAEKQP